MKRIFFIALALLFASDTILPQNNNSTPVPFTSSNLPIVVINTNGQIIPNEYKITVDMGIIYNGEGVRNYLTDPFNNYNGKAGIEIRGSSSQMFPKKQYGFETRDSLGNDLKVSLLGFPSESDWILFAPYNDKSLMRDALTYRLSNDMGRYATRSKYCELVLNGEYMGLYVLFEKIKRDGNRVNIKKLEPADTTGDAVTGGYLIKIDKPDGEVNEGWLSNFLPFPNAQFKIQYLYSYPKPEDIALQQSTYIQHKIFQFETMMKYALNIADTGTGYPKYLDVNSFADFILLNETVKNIDAYRLSTYLYKDRDSRNPKIFAGPVWDFNIALGNAYYYEGGVTEGWQLQYLTTPENMPAEEPFLTPFWWRKLFDDNNFRNIVHARWQTHKNAALSTQHINYLIDSLVTLLDESKTRNFERWPVLGVWVWPNYFVGTTFESEINFLKTWIYNRLYWMNQNMVGGPTGAAEENNNVPAHFLLDQNYPNPFNSSTIIKYHVPSAGTVSLKIYDVIGNEIGTLVNEEKSPGIYRTEWNAGSHPSGIYFCRLQTGNFVSSMKMILMK